jgi:hypothetical protein
MHRDVPGVIDEMDEPGCHMPVGMTMPAWRVDAGRALWRLFV